VGEAGPLLPSGGYARLVMPGRLLSRLAARPRARRGSAARAHLPAAQCGTNGAK